MSLGGGRPVGQGDHLEGNLTGARRPATPGRSVGFEAGPAAGWRGQRERAEPSASCLPYLPEVDSLSILVIVLLLILTLTLGSLTGLCVWRRRRKRSGESRAPGCCHLTGQRVPGRAAPAFPWELQDLWVPGPAVGAGPPPGRAFWGGPCLLPAHPCMRVQVQGQVGRWQWSSCVGVGAALEDLGKSTNALAF